MRKNFISLCAAMCALALALTVAPTFAQRTGDNPRALRPVDALDLPAANQFDDDVLGKLALQWGDHWTDGTTSPFAFTRFDGAYSIKHDKMYFMGGRLPDGSTDGSVWSLSSSGTYTDLGVDLITPVSNYTINVLEDNNRLGFYIFCGRDSAGIDVNVVQVYYPDSNTVVQLGPEDNFPRRGSCMAGLNAVYKNKVYVAGGFDMNTIFTRS